MALTVASMDVNETDKRHVIWCSLDGTNTGADGDTGELGGETISSQAWSVVSGAATLTPSLAAITILHADGEAVTYAINTVSTVTVTAITADSNNNIELLCRITTSGSRILDQTIIIPIEVH